MQQGQQKNDPNASTGNLIEVPTTNSRLFAWLFEKSGLRRLIYVCNALLNMEIDFPVSTGASTPPTIMSGTLVFSPNKAIFTAPTLLNSASPNSGSGASISLAPYSTVENCTVGMIRYVAPTSASSTTHGGATIPGTYFCTLANTGIAPNHPLQTGGMNAYWFLMSTWPLTVGGCDINGNPITLFADGQLSHA